MGRVAAKDAELTFLPLPAYDSAGTLLRAGRGTWRLLKEYVKDAEVVHVDTGGWPIGPGQFGFLLARRMRKKIVLFLGDGADPIGRFHEKMERERSPVKKVKTWLLMKEFQAFARRAARGAEVTFFHNPITASRFGRYARRQHTFFRTFVDDRVRLSAEGLEEKARRVEVEQPLRLVMAGRLIAMKGVHHAIEGVRLARQHGAAVELTILGGGDEEVNLRRQAADSGLSEVVHFGGTVAYGEALFEILRGHHALVVCNRTEEISRNVLLAMACGLVVISYDNPATRGLLVHRANAVVTPMGNVPALGQCFAHLAQDRALAAALLRGGWRTAGQHTFEACHAIRAEYVRSLCGGGNIS